MQLQEMQANASHQSRGHNQDLDEGQDDLRAWEGTSEPPRARARQTNVPISAPSSSAPEPQPRIPRSRHRMSDQGGNSSTPGEREKKPRAEKNKNRDEICVAQHSHYFDAGLSKCSHNSADGFEVLGVRFQTLEHWETKEEGEEEAEEEAEEAGMTQGAQLLARRRTLNLRDSKGRISDDRSIDVAPSSTASPRTPPTDFTHSDIEMDRMPRRKRENAIFEPKLGMKTELFGGETEEPLICEDKPQFPEYVGAMRRLAERTKRYIRSFAKLMDYRPYDPRDHWKPFDESFGLNLPSLPALGPSRWSKLDEGKKCCNDFSPPKAASPELPAELPLTHTLPVQSSMSVPNVSRSFPSTLWSRRGASPVPVTPRPVTSCEPPQGCRRPNFGWGGMNEGEARLRRPKTTAGMDMADSLVIGMKLLRTSI